MQQKNQIIWDLSGTLFKPSEKKLTTDEKKDSALVFFMWSGHGNFTQEIKIALDSLYSLGKQSGTEKEISRIHTGHPVPQIVCDWLMGKLTSSNAKQKALNAADKLGKEVTKEIKRILEAFFDPYFLAQCMQPIPESLRLLNLCAKNKNNQFYVLSNWDKESFDILYNSEHGQDVFKHFKPENIVISANTKSMKPYPEIYKYLLEDCHVDRSKAFFIDDQIENLEAAGQYGIAGERINPKEISPLEHKLIELQIINPELD